MSTDQTDNADNRTPNGASDLLADDDIDDASIEIPDDTYDLNRMSIKTMDSACSAALAKMTAPSSPGADLTPTVAPPTPSTPITGDQMFTKIEKTEHEYDGNYGNVVKTSMEEVSKIVDNIVQQKKAGNTNVSDIASREIDKYYDNEQQENEKESLISPPQELDSIHGEGAEHEEKATFQDEQYGEQPPMSLPVDPSNVNSRTQLGVTGDQLITARRGREKPQKPEQDSAPPNPFKHGSATDIAYSFANIPKPGEPRSPLYKDDDDAYDNVAMELGMTPQTHPEFFQKKKYKLPVRILYNKYCQYCMIISGFVMLSLSVAALVTRGFDEVKKHSSQMHSKSQEGAEINNDGGTQENKKEKLDWWLDMGGNGMTEKQFETLTYLLEDSYLPIWFDRKSGWTGQTYDEALKFCEAHDDFMPCPYDVYCPGKTGKLIEGPVADNISWAPFRDETDGWVQVGAGSRECIVFLGGNTNAKYKNWQFDEDQTEHIMCCLKSPLGAVPTNSFDDVSTDDFSPNDHLDLPAQPVTDSTISTSDVDQWYTEQIIERYNPRWYDRQSKWQGHTYQDAVAFCYANDKQVPCPYSVYCPKGPTGNLISNVKFNEAEAWAATGDRSNQFVMVGHEDPCNRVTASNPGGYGRNNADVDIMSHLMCCSDAITEVTEDLGVAPTVNAVDEHSSSSSSPDTTQQSQSSSSKHAMTELEHTVRSKYIPVWFGFKDGWSGGRYEDAVDFCSTVDPGHGDNFRLCPLMAYCPNGPDYEKPLFLHKDAFETEQWAPTSFAPNAWIQIGQMSKDNPRTCSMYKENFKKSPEWGLDGSEPGLKQHILCCKGGSKGYDYMDDDESTILAQQEIEASQETVSADALTDSTPETSSSTSDQSAQGSIQGMPENFGSYGSTHNGAGNSSPHGGTNTHEAAIVVHLNPVWFDHSSGWNGGSHLDAETFCNTKGNNAPMTLCPYDAYCPHGPTFSALGGPNMDFATQEQYSPYHGSDDHWVLIGRFNNAKTTTCLDYMQLFGEIPSWTKDDSRKELKQHVLCCDTSETLQSSSVVGLQTSSTSSTTSSTEASAKVESQPIIEIDDTPGTWFGVSDGWEGGSRIDAIKFCYNKGEDADGIPLMLCPFEAYCPDGPSNPIASGNTNIGINEDMEQWAPTLSKPNHWVLVGNRGGNDSTTCLDTWQLEGDDDPSWGKDGSNAEHKHHVKCCSLN